MIVSSILPEISKSDLQVFEELSSGGQGTVYRAKWKSKKKIVAVKKLLVLEEEAKILCHLRHKNIVLFYGANQKPPDYFIVTEFAEKGSLYSYIHNQNNPQLDFSGILRWALDIARGVHYLHNEAPDHPIIHRDLKSRNVVITAQDVCKLCDFGTSKHVGRSTIAGFYGTAPWMSPEQLCSQRVSEGTDVWSYAVVLWELVTGEEPWIRRDKEGKELHQMNFFQIATLVVDRGVRLVIPRSAPAVMAQLLTECWEKLSEDRPPMGEVLERLNAMNADEEVNSEGSKFLEQKSSWLREIEDQQEELKRREESLVEKEKYLAAWETNLSILENSPRPPLRRFHSYDIKVWNESQVCEWLRTLGFEKSVTTKLCDAVSRNDINGERLILLTNKDLDRLGVQSVGYQVQVLEEIRRLAVENARLANFPPLNYASLTAGNSNIDKNHRTATSENNQPKILNISVLVGFYVRTSPEGAAHFRWKLFADFDFKSQDEARTLREKSGLIKDLTFVFPHISEPYKMTQCPAVMGVWLEGLENTVEVQCVVNFSDTTVLRPRNTRFKVPVNYDGRGDPVEKEIELTVKASAFISRKQFKRGKHSPQPNFHTTASTPNLQGKWQEKAFADAVPVLPPRTAANIQAKNPVWSQIAATLKNSVLQPSSANIDYRKSSAPTPYSTPSPQFVVAKPSLNVLRAVSDETGDSNVNDQDNRLELAVDKVDFQADSGSDLDQSADQIDRRLNGSFPERPRAISLTPDLRNKKRIGGTGTRSPELGLGSGDIQKKGKKKRVFRVYKRSQSDGKLISKTGYSPAELNNRLANAIVEQKEEAIGVNDLSPVSENQDSVGFEAVHETGLAPELKKQDSKSKYSQEVHGGMAKLRWKKE